MKKYLIVLSTIIIFIFWGGVVYADINSGLVAHYLLEGNANDSSGNNYHGTENNGVSFV